MKTLALLGLSTSMMLISACNSPEDAAEDRVENVAEASAANSGAAQVALGLTEQQLLDADLVDSTGMEIGDVTAVLRDAGGQVDRLLVEVEDSNPDKYVHVPVTGLKAAASGNDWNLATTMTMQQLAALPAVSLTPSTTPITAAPAPSVTR